MSVCLFLRIFVSLTGAIFFVGMMVVRNFLIFEIPQSTERFVKPAVVSDFSGSKMSVLLALQYQHLTG